LAACSGISTNVQTAPGANLAAYQTFTWAPRDPGQVQTLVDQAVRSSLEQDLAARGVVLAAAGQTPDFFVGYHGKQEQKTEVYPGGGYGWYGYGYYPYVSTYTEGTLILDFIDARTHKTFWRGTATATLSEPNNPDPEKISKAIAKLMEHYPAQVAAAQRQPM
jgi:hypothetical protein